MKVLQAIGLTLALLVGGLAVSVIGQITVTDPPGAAGAVSISGTPVDNQIAIWTDPTTLEGDTDFLWDGTVMTLGAAGVTMGGVNGVLTITGIGPGFDESIVWDFDTLDGRIGITPSGILQFTGAQTITTVGAMSLDPTGQLRIRGGEWLFSGDDLLVGTQGTGNDIGSPANAIDDLYLLSEIFFGAGENFIIDGDADDGSARFRSAGTTNTLDILGATEEISSTVTWNAGATTFTGWQLLVTDTASAAASLLVDLQVGASTQFSVSKAGTIFAGNFSEPNTDTVVIGTNAEAGSGDENVYAGSGVGDASATGGNNVLIGSFVAPNTLTSGSGNVIIGSNAAGNFTTGASNVCVGADVCGNIEGGAGNILLGDSTAMDDAGGNARLAIGRNALVLEDNQALIGTAAGAFGYTSMFLGQGVVKATPLAFALNVAGGSGTDNPAADWTFGGGRGTGTGAGGDLVFSTATPGGSGSALNALVEAIRIDDQQVVTVANLVTWPDGVRQTFNPDATTPGFNVGSLTGDPSTPINADLWYDSTAEELTARINGVNVALGGGGAPTDATYITQTPDGTLSAEQALSALASGIMRVATTTGVVTSLTNSSGIAANLSDETGTGALVFGTAPAISAPVFSGLMSITQVNVDIDGATTFAVTSSYTNLTCTGAETINTITGGVTGAILYIELGDSTCTLANDDAPTATDAIDLDGAGDVGGDVNMMVALIFTGSNWVALAPHTTP